jgi:hypothetical protein
MRAMYQFLEGYAPLAEVLFARMVRATSPLIHDSGGTSQLRRSVAKTYRGTSR